MTIRLFLFAGLFFLCFSEQASSDVVHLKNERNLTGKVVENNERFVRLELSGGTVEFPRSDVEWVLLGTEKEIEDQLLQLLIESTRLRLSSDVPLGVLLSGGLDSSMIVGLISKLGSSPIITFTIGYPRGAFSASYDETDKAREVARCFGVEHREIEISSQEFEILPTILWHLDEPISD